MTDFRITFSKTGPLVFISHLDLTHTFVRALNRAGIRLRYSSGFNPHPKIVFALPLSVGMAGENELCDIGLEHDMEPEEFLVKLRGALPEHLSVKSVCAAEGKFKNIKSAEYLFEISQNTPDANLCENIRNFLAKDEIIVTKKSKSGEKQVNIRPQIFSYHIAEIGEAAELVLCTDASPDGYLNPEYVMQALCDAGIVSDCSWKSTRTEIKLK